MLLLFFAENHLNWQNCFALSFAEMFVGKGDILAVLM